MRYIPKLQTAWSPLTLTPEKEQAAQKLIQQRALQGYNTSGVNWLKETPEITSKRKALASKQQTEYQNKRFANRTNEVPVLGMPAATQIGLKNVHPEFALMTGGVGSGMSGIKGAMGYGAIQGGLWNSAGIAGEQNLGGLVGDVIGGGIAGGVIKGASPYIKKGVDYIRNYVKNPWKLNPKAFKPNSEMLYRGIGRTGLDDALNSGVLRTANKKANFGNDVYMTRNFDEARGIYSRDQSTYKGDPFDDTWEVVKPKDSKSYIAEIPESSTPTLELRGGNVFINKGEIPIKDIKFYKEHWWKRYKEVPKQPQIDLNFESTNHHTTPFLDDIQVKEAYGKIAKSAMKFMKLQKSPEFQKRYKEFAYGWHTGSDINIINPEVIPYQVFNNTSRSANPHQHMFKNALGFFDNNQNKAFVKINTNTDLEQTTGHELLHKFTKANYRNEYDNNPNWENKWWFDEFASKKYPGNLPEEHLANMIGYRVSKNIPPERNFTAEESIDFINNHIRLYNNTIKQRYPNYKENLTSAVEFIKAFGAVAAPVTIADKFKK